MKEELNPCQIYAQKSNESLATATGISQRILFALRPYQSSLPCEPDCTPSGIELRKKGKCPYCLDSITNANGRFDEHPSPDSEVILFFGEK
jgi:hypothetical protein